MGTTRGKAGKGQTFNLNGERVSKNSSIIHFEGTADELNSHLGLLKTQLENVKTRHFIEEIQKKIIKLMSHASDPKNSSYFFTEEEVVVLEKETSILCENFMEQSNFILPGRSVLEAQIHIARTVARRAERMFAAVDEEYGLCSYAASYMNKLSGYLFALAVAS